MSEANTLVLTNNADQALALIEQAHRLSETVIKQHCHCEQPVDALLEKQCYLIDVLETLS